MRQLIVGNWKMHGVMADLTEIESIANKVQPHVDIVVCPPAALIAEAARIAARRIAIGGQNCHAEVSGPHTGDISAEMLRDAGASAVIVGHSERRRDHGETDRLISAKTSAAQRAGLLAIVRVGESESQRDAGAAYSTCGGQVVASIPAGMTGAELAIGYEPLWAIGSGRPPTSQEITQMHAHIRDCLIAHLGTRGKSVRILYGGSVNPVDAREILELPGVGGALIGGASLKAKEFVAIVANAPGGVAGRLAVA